MNEAIVLIPGFEIVERTATAQRLVDGCVATVERADVTRTDAAADAPHIATLTVESTSIDTKTIDVYEAYWADLIGRTTDASARVKLLRGFQILSYWLRPRMLWPRGGSLFLQASVLFGATALLGWYLTVIWFVGGELYQQLAGRDVTTLEVAQALLEWVDGDETRVHADRPAALEPLPEQDAVSLRTLRRMDDAANANLAAALEQHGLARSAEGAKQALEFVREHPERGRGDVRAIADQLDTAPTWLIWLDRVASFLGSIFAIGFIASPLNRLVDLAGFAKSYLRDEPTSSGVGLRARVRERASRCLAVAAARGYDRIQVVGHSFGTIVAIDVVADLAERIDTPVDVVTLGSPAVVLQHRSEWLRRESDAAFASPAVQRWTDWSTGADWLGGAVPGGDDRVERRTLSVESTFADRVTGRPHLAYYAAQDVLESLVVGTGDGDS